MEIPEIHIPITEIPYSDKVCLCIKREDLIHPEISGNKYWKLLYNIQNYLAEEVRHPFIITFGGAFSNHIAAVAALGRIFGIPTLGIIRGEELAEIWPQNPTLSKAYENGMQFHFVTRTEYRDKEKLCCDFSTKFPEALVVPEGGSNKMAVLGIRHMLDSRTAEFDYLCTAVGTGGTVAGLSLYAEEHQKIIGFKVVNDAETDGRVARWSGRKNVELVDAFGKGYGKVTEELIKFVNTFSSRFRVPIEPVYTGKMMMKLLQMIDEGYFPEGARILAFHTGGLQGSEGMNVYLKKKNKTIINTVK